MARRPRAGGVRRRGFAVTTPLRALRDVAEADAASDERVRRALAALTWAPDMCDGRFERHSLVAAGRRGPQERLERPSRAFAALSAKEFQNVRKSGTLNLASRARILRK